MNLANGDWMSFMARRMGGISGSKNNMTSRLFQLRRFIDKHPGCTLQDITSLLNISKGAASGVLSKLGDNYLTLGRGFLQRKFFSLPFWNYSEELFDAFVLYAQEALDGSIESTSRR